MNLFRNLLKVFGGSEVQQTGTPQGAGLMTYEIDHMIARGMGRHMTVGAESTGIVGGGAGTVLDLDQPEVAIGVPEGYAIKLLRITAQVQVALAAADNDENEIVFGVDVRGSLQGPLSAETCTIETPVNMRTDLGFGSACQCASAFTADMQIKPKYAAASDPYADSIALLELCRTVQTFDIMGTATNAFFKILEVTYQPIWPLLLVGPCTVLGYWGGTVATIGGFAQLNWVEGRVEDFFFK